MSSTYVFLLTVLTLTVVSAHIEKRSTPCIGCPSDASVDDPEIKNLLVQVLALKDAGTQVMKVNKATKQVVAGVKYVVEFEAKAGNVVKICDTTFVHQAWKENKIEVLDFECRAK